MRFDQQPIINSFLDTDLYKLNMMQVVFHHYPNVFVEHRFECRDKDIDLIPYIPEIEKELSHLQNLEFRQNEIFFLKTIPYLKNDFLEFLKDFRFDISQLHIGTTVDKDSGKAILEIKTQGLWWQTILYDTFVLAVVNEVYFRNRTKSYSKREFSDLLEEGRARLQTKLDMIKDKPDFTFTEMGTRRRFSREWQMEIVDYIRHQAPNNLYGTSNLYLANDMSIKPIGTMAHEYLQAFQGITPHLEDSQSDALEAWIKEYRGNPGIALTDVINMDSFLNDFDLYFAKLFNGLRHDSGDPFVWAEKAIAHYKKLNIDPKTKILVFSDGLDFSKAVNIYDAFKDKINVSFGIGTNITNDLGLKPLDIVMKMTKCNNKIVGKITDSPEKTSSHNSVHIEKLKRAFKID